MWAGTGQVENNEVQDSFGTKTISFKYLLLLKVFEWIRPVPKDPWASKLAILNHSANSKSPVGCHFCFEYDFEHAPKFTRKLSRSTSRSTKKFYNLDTLSTSTIWSTKYDLEYEIVLKKVL